MVTTTPTMSIESISNSEATRLKLHVEDLELMFEDKDTILAEITKRFALAKGEGYHVKVIKAVLARRALERAAVEEFDQLIVTYEENLA